MDLKVYLTKPDGDMEEHSVSSKDEGVHWAADRMKEINPKVLFDLRAVGPCYPDDLFEEKRDRLLEAFEDDKPTGMRAKITSNWS